ncbi:MAG TPA: AAA family ATPase [Solirubrobacteraceae bacterium]|nr:AAA family ATPase [Solirubrobacteraceae bacterium]
MTTIRSITAAAAKPVQVKYAWKPRIPQSETTILAGVPGIGKTQLALGICADATRGTLDGDLRGPVDVAYVSAEDSIEYTLAPRFLAAGGDPSRVHFFQAKRLGEDEDPSIQLPDDLPALDEWIGDTGSRILVLDPFVAMLPPSLNAHRDQHVRRAIAPLAHMCHERGVLVLLILHLNKSAEGDALSRLSGSVGIGAAARSVLLFAPNPEDPEGEAGDERILAHAKSNLGRKAGSLAYRIEQRVIEGTDGPIETSIAVQHGETSVSAGDLLGVATSSSEASARTEAREFLIAELANGPVPTKQLRAQAEEAGHNWRTVERAKTAIGIRAKKSGSSWAWELNTVPDNPPVGLDGVVGVDGMKTDKADKTAGIESRGGDDLDPDEAQLELERARRILAVVS